MKPHERLSDIEFDPGVVDDKDYEFYVPKTREKKNKKDFNKTYEKKMRDLMQEAELAEKAARNMFKTTKSKSDDVDSELE